MTHPRSFNHRLFLWPLIALMVGLVLTAMLVQQTRRWVDEQLTARLAFDAQQLPRACSSSSRCRRRRCAGW